MLKYFGVRQLFEKSPINANVIFLSEEEIKKRSALFEQRRKAYVYTQSLSEEHCAFLQRIALDENNRQTIIENKLGQIIGQSGIIFTLVSLLIPILYDNTGHLNGFLRAAMIFLFVTGFLFFLVSIIQAARSFSIEKFIYSRPSIDDVLKPEITDKTMLMAEEIRALLTGIPINTNANDRKATLLIYAHRSFIWGFICIGLLGILISADSLFYKKEKEVVLMERPEEIRIVEDEVSEIRSMVDILSMKATTKDSARLEEISERLQKMSGEIEKIKAGRAARRH